MTRFREALRSFISAMPRNFIAVALEGEMMGWKPEWLEWWWLESVLGNDLSTVIKKYCLICNAFSGGGEFF